MLPKWNIVISDCHQTPYAHNPFCILSPPLCRHMGVLEMFDMVRIWPDKHWNENRVPLTGRTPGSLREWMNNDPRLYHSVVK